MKKYLSLLMIIMSVTCEGQSTKDTICLDVPTAKKLLSDARQKDVLAERIVLMEARISEKELQIKALNDKDSTTVAKYKEEVNFMTLDLNALKYENKKLRRRATRDRIVAGAVTAGLIYLSSKK